MNKVLDTTSGAVVPYDKCAGVLDTLAIAAKNAEAIRESLAKVPGIGGWLLASFDGFNCSFVQLFANREKLATREAVKNAAEIFASHVGGEWKPFGELGEGRVGKVWFEGASHPSIVILHNVDGVAIAAIEEKTPDV